MLRPPSPPPAPGHDAGAGGQDVSTLYGGMDETCPLCTGGRGGGGHAAHLRLELLGILRLARLRAGVSAPRAPPGARAGPGRAGRRRRSARGVRKAPERDLRAPKVTEPAPSVKSQGARISRPGQTAERGSAAARHAQGRDLGRQTARVAPRVASARGRARGVRGASAAGGRKAERRGRRRGRRAGLGALPRLAEPVELRLLGSRV